MYYSFLRADFRFSSLSSWAASRSFTSDPGTLAGIISSCKLLLFIKERKNWLRKETGKNGSEIKCKESLFVCHHTQISLTDLLESEEIPRAFSKEVLYFSMRREKSLYLLSTAVTHFLISVAWACPFSQKPSASCINNFTLSLVCYEKQENIEQLQALPVMQGVILLNCY